MAEFPSPMSVPPEIRSLVDSWESVPAFVRDRHLNVLMANRLASALSSAFRPGINLVRSTFESDMLQRNPTPEVIATHVAGTLRKSLNSHELDANFEGIVEDLQRASTEFARAWESSGAGMVATDDFTFEVPELGSVILNYVELEVPGHFDLTVVVWRAADAHSRQALEQLSAGLRRPGD